MFDKIKYQYFFYFFQTFEIFFFLSFIDKSLTL